MEMSIGNVKLTISRLSAACASILVILLLSGCGGGKTQQFAEVPGFASVPGMEGASATTATPAATGTENAAVPTRADESEILRIGDALTINFSDLPFVQPPFEERVKGDGSITLLQNQTFQAAGKTRGELEREIRARYVPKIFKNLTVTIKPQDRFYFVGGEVKMPARQIYLGPITVTRAIQSCGDFTDFANKKKVKLIHPDGKSETINCVKAIGDPRLDPPVYPGDKIHVPRRFL